MGLVTMLSNAFSTATPALCGMAMVTSTPALAEDFDLGVPRVMVGDQPIFFLRPHPNAHLQSIASAEGKRFAFIVPSSQLERTDVWLDIGQPITAGISCGISRGAVDDDDPMPLAGEVRYERLVNLQASLCLRLHQLASVLRVSRPALYRWMDPEEGVVLREANRARILLVEEVAAKWAALTTKPLSMYLHERLSDNRSVLAWLQDENLSPSLLLGELQQLISRVSPRKTVTSSLPGRIRATHRSIPVDD